MGELKVKVHLTLKLVFFSLHVPKSGEVKGIL